MSLFISAATKFVLCATIFLAFGANAAKSKKPQEKHTAQPTLVWPSPPAPARIAFVQTIHQPSDFGIKHSGFGRFSNWLTGAEKGNERLLKPFGIAFDENENLCLTDTGANAVCFFDRARKKWKRWEKIGKVHFQSPVAVAKYQGTFFVADSALACVLAFSESGKWLFQIKEKLERPSGVVIAAGRLFVVDSQRHCVVCFDLKGNFVSEFGKRGTAPNEFNFPSHIGADVNDFLYVTDSMNGRIQVFDANGKFLRCIGEPGRSTGQFSRPKGVAANSQGHVYAIDGMFDNVQIFSADGKFLLNFGEAGSNPGEFWLPNGIAISRANEIFVTDSYNRRIQVFKYVGER